MATENALAHAKSPFLKEAFARGYLHQCTDVEGLDAKFAAGPVTAYIGYDCTADSLHVGHLMNIMMLRLFQRTGNRPLTLMGGGTTKIGDPSDKNEARPLLTDEIIAANMAGIRGIFAKFLSYDDSATGAIMANNADWLEGLKYIDFLREVGRHFSVNAMTKMDFVKRRLDNEQNLSFLEFNYMIIQGYDFLELSRRHDVALQMGGSDQWGNIVQGIELGRRIDGTELFGLTVPLLATASGQKMGKSAGGAVWLNQDRLNDFDYYQFWRNTEDADVGRFLKLFTELPIEQCDELGGAQGAAINEGKKILAYETTAMCRGKEAADAAANAAATTFGGGGVSADLPKVQAEAGAIEAGMSIQDAFIAAGLAASKGEVKRLIKGGGARLNGEKIDSDELVITAADIDAETGAVKLSSGKKKHVLLVA